MPEVPQGALSIAGVVRAWWGENRRQRGFLSTARDFASRVLEFVRESFPDRKRQRYGDIDFDWDYRVDTTCANVGWRDRLLGMFLSPYQATEPAFFHEMFQALAIDFSQFTFIDLGSGKGRTLLMAADYPFRRIVGLELVPTLHAAAVKNIEIYKSENRRCFAVESICADARQFVFPPEPTVLYLFNPLPPEGLAKVVANLEKSLDEHPRVLYVLYHNPSLERILVGNHTLKRVSGTHQYVIYVAETQQVPGLTPERDENGV